MVEGNQLEKWIKEIEKNKKEITKLKSQDRLALVASITKLHNNIFGSLQGWTVWLKNPLVMNQLSEEELKETFETFKKLASDFLDLDIKMSSSVLKKQKVKRKKRTKKREKNYVA